MFCPTGSSSVSDVTSTVGDVVDLSSADLDVGAVRLLCSSPSGVSVVFGDSMVSPSSIGMVIVNSPEVVKIPAGATHLAVLSLGGERLLYTTIGKKA